MWRVFNPLARPLSGWLPFWVLLETTGRRTGQIRRTPLANGPMDDGGMYLISVHGAAAAFCRNIEADPRVRLKRRGRWRTGAAHVIDWDDAIFNRFSAYARSARRTFGDQPTLVRLDFD